MLVIIISEINPAIVDIEKYLRRPKEMCILKNFEFNRCL